MSCSLLPCEESIPPKHTTLLSLGMGVESVAIAIRWLLEAHTRPCPLDELIAITGDEYEDTRSLMEEYVLPLMRDFGIRYVQVAHAGYETIGDIPYIWIERRADRFPTSEELFCVAPATVETKARYGVPWFDSKWYTNSLFGGADPIA